MRNIGVFLVCCFLAACASGSAPVRFYTLAPLANVPVQATATKTIGSVGIGPIEMPAYLDRQEIVLPTSKHRRDLAEFDLWIEPLKANMTRTLSENVAVLLDDSSVYGFPWSTSLRVKTQVLIDVVQFDGVPGEQATLIARWTAVDGDSRIILASNRVNVSVPMQGDTYEALANAMSIALLNLSKDISAKLISEF